MHKFGVSLDSIAAEEGVTKHAIFSIIRRYKHQNSAKSLPRSGRPTILTSRDKSHILRIIDSEPFITTSRLLRESGAHCHRTTLTRWLIKQGIQHHLASQRPFLSEETAELRLDFALKYVDEPASFWYTWIFSDEVSIDRSDGERRHWAFTKYGERLKKKNVQPKKPRTRHSQMFFSAFTLDYAIDLVRLAGDPNSKRGGVTSRVILACLQEHLPEISEEGRVFQHDNGPTFTAHLVQNWLREYASSQGIRLTEWPPYSPDLNPIENLWAILKERICNRYPDLIELPKTLAAKERLIECAQELWNEIEDEVLENVLKSMPRRMRAVVDANGWYTKY